MTGPRALLRPTPWALAPAALWPMIRALLYRLLIISAHLQRHGIRLLIAIGRFNARAAAFGADPPAPFDSESLPLPFSPLSTLCLPLSPFFSLFPLDFFPNDRDRRFTGRCPSLRNPLQLSASGAKGQHHRRVLVPRPRAREISRGSRPL